MIFDSVVLFNFGVYLGRHVVDLRVSRGRPIILIGAMNGSGKTTLLDAMQLALYGKNAKCSGRDRIGYHDYLASMISRFAPPHQGASVEFNFRTRQGGRDHEFRLVRTWLRKGSAIKETFEVYRNGALDVVASERWTEFVEELMPSRMADLFFFDGEKIEGLADPETASELLRQGVHSLLGIDLVHDLAASLQQVERKRKTDGVGPDEKAKLLEIETQYAEMQREIGEIQQRRAQQVNILDALTKRESDSQAAFSRVGGPLADKREAFQLLVTHLTTRRNTIEDELRALAAGVLPLAVAQDLLIETVEKATRVRKSRQAAILRTDSEVRDAEIETFLRNAGLDGELIQSLHSFLNQDRARRYVVTERGDFFPDQLLDQFSHEALELARDEHKKIIAEYGDCLERLSELERNLAAIPSDESLQPILRDLNDCRKLKIEHNAILRQLDEDLKSARYKADRLRGQAEREAERLGERLTREQVSSRIINHSLRARRMLEKFERSLLVENLHKLEASILDAYKVLLRKTSMVERIRIDPQTFKLAIVSPTGAESPTERLSAGERQLLAVATLWGLTCESGRKLPTVIDTPLSRLDSQHRAALVKSYFPKAGHQVILLSTDEEIVGRYSEMLQPYIASRYTIVHYERLKTSKFENTYFSEEVVA